MSQPSPTINGLEFARDGGELSGSIEAARLARLSQIGAIVAGLDYTFAALERLKRSH